MTCSGGRRVRPRGSCPGGLIGARRRVRPRGLVARGLAGLLLLLLPGCGAVTVNLTVHNRTDRRVPVELARDVDGAPGPGLILGKMLPHGRVKATFTAEAGERFVVHADREVLGERTIGATDADPVVWELEVTR